MSTHRFPLLFFILVRVVVVVERKRERERERERELNSVRNRHASCHRGPMTLRRHFINFMCPLGTISV